MYHDFIRITAGAAFAVIQQYPGSDKKAICVGDIDAAKIFRTKSSQTNLVSQQASYREGSP